MPSNATVLTRWTMLAPLPGNSVPEADKPDKNN
jgi:hypothetical protein